MLLNQLILKIIEMAQDKKSFVAYSDWHGMFKALPDEVAGKLIKHIFSYVNDENPDTDDYIIKALFEQIKATLKRDLIKWDNQRSQRSEAGKKSAEIRSKKYNENPTVVETRERKSTVTDNVTVNVNDNVNVILLEKETKGFIKPSQENVFEYLNGEKKISFTEAQKFAEEFWNFYESNGWKVGKNKMKNWKASATGWVGRASNFKTNNNNNGRVKRSTEDAIRDFLAE